ncbi:hypothetical protein JW848_04640 [Candidatus Bipolaricaulota bacterium]|nr:hypothetical protein [Candidatus Bipolaricaulota bacterium]
MNGLAALLFGLSGSLLALLSLTSFGRGVPGLVFGPLLVMLPAAVCVASRRVRGMASVAVALHCAYAALITFLGASPFVVAASIGLAFLGWHTERLDRVLGKADGAARRAIFIRVIAWEGAVLAVGLALVGVALIGEVSLPFLPSIAAAVAAMLLMAIGIRRGLSK